MFIACFAAGAAALMSVKRAAPSHAAGVESADDALAALLSARDAKPVAPALSRRGSLGALSAAAVTAFANAAAVDASGGATAGGAYLLRAKERYNARVVAGAKAVKAASGDDAAVAALFSAGDDGPLADLEAAGFLLANAFRINSTQNPDKILQVQKFKAFKKDADETAAFLKKKKKADAKASFEKSLASLDQYLLSVGL